MRVIFAGGGTGGHLFPGLAVAREFQRRDPMTEILFVGTEQGIEFRVLPKAGFRLETLTVKGLKGRGMRGLLDALYGVPASVVRSLAVIKKFRPDFTNKILSRLVNRVFTSYGKSVEYFPRARVIETGNPVRWQKLPEVQRRDKFSLLVFGGSAGARRINFAVVDALKQLTDLQSALFVAHQTGELDYAAIKEAYAALPFEAEITPFIDKMDEAYARADLVLCRAGATTVAELTAFGKAAIVVPYPYAIYDHQRGAAEMILDQVLDGQILSERIRSYVADRGRIDRMASAARAMGRPQAATRIVDECYALAHG